jgi:hypothetical protein
MGLDITAYEHVTKVGDRDDFDVDYRDEHGGIQVYNYSEFLDRGTPFKNFDLLQTSGESFSFRAGSYGGYNDWRDQLAEFAALHHTDAFIEQIWFADNEGTMAAPCCARLAEAYERFAGDAEKFAGGMSPDDKAWFLRQYRNWTKAFRLAAVDGAVEFH